MTKMSSSWMLFVLLCALFAGVRSFNATLTFTSSAPQTLSVPLLESPTEVTATVQLSVVTNVQVCFSQWPTAPDPSTWGASTCAQYTNFAFSNNTALFRPSRAYGSYRYDQRARMDIAKRATTLGPNAVFLRNQNYYVFVYPTNATIVTLSFFAPQCDNGAFGFPECETGVAPIKLNSQVVFANVDLATSVVFQVGVTSTQSQITLQTGEGTAFAQQATAPTIFYSASFNAVPANGHADIAPVQNGINIVSPALGNWYILVQATQPPLNYSANATSVTCSPNNYGPFCNITTQTLSDDVSSYDATSVPIYYEFAVKQGANFSITAAYVNTSIPFTPLLFTQRNQIPSLFPMNNYINNCNYGNCTVANTQQIVGVPQNGTLIVAVLAPLGSYFLWNSVVNPCPDCHGDGTCFDIGVCACTNDAATADCSTPSSGLTTTQIVLISVASVILAAVVVAVVVFVIVKCTRKRGYQSI